MKTILSAAAFAVVAAVSFGQTGAVRGVLVVAGSTPGAFDSHFKTALQLHNRGTTAAHGMLVFHPNGRAASAGDPFVAYGIDPRETLHFDDVVAAMGATGLGSIDIIPSAGPVPAVMARAFDDRPEGTSGATIPLLDPRDALAPATPGTLIVPPDLDRFRFNIGIRSLSDGAVVRLTVFGANGIERFAVERTFAPDLLEQKPAADMLGAPLFAGDSIAVQLVSGSAFVYGTTTDNISNDPSVQAAAALDLP
ncbi:MAG: hypothetical protein ACRD2J_17140 [Thermoanaerobaculia bacterium]